MMSALNKTALAAALAAAFGVACTERQAEMPSAERQAERSPEMSATQRWPSFQEADRNGDGALDSREAAMISGLNFSAADRDYDGKLSEAEYEAAQAEGGPQAQRRG